MAEQTSNNAGSPQNPAPADRPKKKSGWGKRILLGLGILVVILILLVALAPTIAGMGWVRSIVVSKINQNLNGAASIDDWSLGWFSGIDVNGVSVVDTSGQKVIELRRLHTDLQLIDAIRGNLDLGKVVVDGLRANIVVDEQGNTNLQKIAKEQPDQPQQEGGKLPDVKGTIVLTDCQATVSGAGVPQPINAAIGGQVDIPGINQTITNALNTALTIGGQPAGKINLDGTLDLIQNNEVAMDQASVGQKLTIAGLQLASVAPFLPKDQVSRLQGVTDGQLVVDLRSGSTGTLQGQVTTQNVVVSGGALQGDTFESDKVVLTIPPTAIAMPAGMGAWNAYRVRTGGDTPTPVTVSLGRTPKGEEIGAVQLLMDATPDSVVNAASGKAPGADGRVQASQDIDVAALARMLPNTLGLVEGVRLERGKLTGQTTLALTPRAGTIQSVTDLSEMAGVNTKANRPIAIRPIHVDAKATSGAGSSVADFRDLALNLTSGFANASFKGQSVADLTGQAKGDLKAMQNELGQVVDFGALDLAGTFDMNLASSGNLAEANGQGKVETQVTLRDLRVTGLTEGKTIDQRWMNIAAGGTLIRGTDTPVKAVQDGTVTVRTGDPNQPTIDVALATNVDLAANTAGFSLQKFFVDAPKAQNEFAAFIPGDYRVATGTVAAAAVGTWENGTLKLQNLTAQPQNLTLVIQPKDGTPATEVIRDLTMNVETAGVVATGDSTNINLSKLNVTEQNKRLLLQKVGDGPLVLTTGKAGFSGQGKLQLGADLAFVNGLVQAFSGGNAQVVAQNKAGDVRSGYLDGTLGFDTAANKPTQVAGDFKVANLVVTTADGATQPETVTLALRADATPDFSAVNAQQVSLKSRFANLDVTDSLLKLKDPSKPDAAVSVWEMLQKANVSVDVPDVGQAYTIATAFMPPAPPTTQPAAVTQAQPQPTPAPAGDIGSQVISRPAGAAAPATPAPAVVATAAPLEPLSINGGRLTAKLNVARQDGATNVNVTDLSGGDIQLRRGQRAYSVRPFNVQFAASVKAAEAISQIDVTQLVGKLGIAELTMEQPISIKNLAGDQMAATGAVRLAGQLQQASELLAVLQGQPLPYNGNYVVVQRLTTEGNTVGLAGNVDLTDFQVLDDRGQVQFAEQKVGVTNDLRIDQKAKDLTGNVAVNSQALGLKFNGGVRQFDTQRTITDGTTLALNYDAARAWQIVRPMLAPETRQSLADLQIAGVKQTALKLGGSYPADVPFNQAIRSLRASGALPLDQLSTQGINATAINPGIDLADGKVRVTAAPGAATRPTTSPTDAPSGPVTALVNGGSVDLTDAVIDLTAEHPRLSIPADKVLAQNVALNAVLASHVNRILPVFDPRAQAAVMDVRVVRCDRLPLGELMKQNVPANDGSATFVLSFRDVKPGGPIIGVLDKVTNNVFSTQAQVSVTPTTVTIANGQTKIDNFALAFGQQGHRYLAMNGAVPLDPSGRLNLNAVIPPALFRQITSDLVQYLPEGITLPIGGSVQAPQLIQFDKIIQQNLVEAGKKALAARVLGGGRAPAGSGATTQPGGQPQPDRGLGGLLGDVLGGGGRQQPAPTQQQQPQQQQPPAPAQQPAQQGQTPAQGAAPAGQQPAAQPAQPADVVGGLLDALTRDRDKERNRDRNATTQPTQQRRRR